jgi:hypothetical protein
VFRQGANRGDDRPRYDQEYRRDRDYGSRRDRDYRPRPYEDDE